MWGKVVIGGGCFWVWSLTSDGRLRGESSKNGMPGESSGRRKKGERNRVRVRG